MCTAGRRCSDCEGLGHEAGCSFCEGLGTAAARLQGRAAESSSDCEGTTSCHPSLPLSHPPALTTSAGRRAVVSSVPASILTGILVASSPRRYPSPPRSSPVSSPVVAAPSSRRVIPPRLYPQRQPVRAPCKSSLCGRRVVVAAARKTIFWKCHYEFTCHVFHPKSTVLFTPPFTALVAAWISGSRDCIGIDCRPARGIRCRGRGPRTPATPWHAWHPPRFHRSEGRSEEDGSEDRNEDRSGELPGWFFGRQGEDRSEDRSEDRRRIRVRIGVRVERGSE